MDKSSTAFFADAMTQWRSTKALLVANRVGVFIALGRRSLSAHALAQELSLDTWVLRQLLSALTASSILKYDAAMDAYCCGDLALKHLVTDASQPMQDNLYFQDLVWERWNDLGQTLRRGKGSGNLQGLLTCEDPTFADRYIRAMDNLGGVAPEVAKALVGPTVRRIIDVGGGPGAYARAMTSVHDGAQVRLLDLAPTLAIARELNLRYGANRIELVECDYRRDAYGADADLVLFSHVTHDESPSDVVAMLRRAREALAPGGAIAIHDWVVDQGGHAPPHAAYFSLNLLAYTEWGRIYSVEEYERLLGEAGCDITRNVKVLEDRVANPTTLIVAKAKS